MSGKSGNRSSVSTQVLRKRTVDSADLSLNRMVSLVAVLAEKTKNKEVGISEGSGANLADLEMTCLPPQGSPLGT